MLKPTTPGEVLIIWLGYYGKFDNIFDMSSHFWPCVHLTLGPAATATCEPTAGPRSAVGNVSGYREDACLTADPGVASSIPVRSHTFVEIDHEMISTVILLPSADSFKKGCCQLQAKVCARITG